MFKSILSVTACPTCNAESSVVTHRGSFTTKYNQNEVTVHDVESLHCESCGEEFYTPEQNRALSLAVKRAIRERTGVLEPEQIVALRKRLRISQEELEAVLGLGPKVVTRWENGRVVPGRAADKLLRVLDRDPGVLEILRELQRQESHPSVK